MTPAQRLEAGFAQLEIVFEPSAAERLLDYAVLLLRWNRVSNLTAVRDPVAVVDRHVLDCAAVLPFVRGDQVLDLGSGGGLPGLIFAILRPDWRLTLLDSNGKKTRFLTQATIALGLGNVTVVNARAESWQTSRIFDTVVSRAFTQLEGFTDMASRYLDRRGEIIAMVGKKTGHTLGQRVGDCVVDTVRAVTVPFNSAERHIVSLKPIGTMTP